MTKAELKAAKKWKAKPPDPGDYMVDIYDAGGHVVVEQKNFPSGRGLEKFIDSLPREAMIKVYRFVGWELSREIGNWYKE